MSNSDLPDTGTAGDDALSFDDGVESIANLLGPAQPEPKEKKASETKEPEAELEDDADPAESTDDDVDGDHDEDESDEGEDGPDDTPNDFAPETGKVKMADGRTITVAELREHADKRISDFQRDYTRKTTEHAEREKSVADAARVLAEQRDILVAMYKAKAIQPPDPSQLPSPAMIGEDPVGYMLAKDTYDAQMRAYEAQQREFYQLQTMRQQDMQRQQQETAAELQRRLVEETERMITFLPELKDPAKREAFARNAADYAGTYSITPEEIAEIGDARMLAVLRDAMEYQKIKVAAKSLPKALEGKPKVLSGQRRPDPKSSSAREAETRKAALRKSGSFEAGIASLMDLDL